MQKKIGFAVGGAVVLGGMIYLFARRASAGTVTPPPPRPRGLTFATRNLPALDAVVNAVVSDPNIGASLVSQLAESLSYYGFFEQELRLREKLSPNLVKQLAPGTADGATRSWRSV